MTRVPVVLVVEDDPLVRSALVRELSAGHVVHSVDSALGALRHVVSDPPDLVVLDLGLPDLDGSQALTMIRGVHDVPVIVATARNDDAEIVRLLRAGADDYLVKPFSGEQLCARVAAVLRRVQPGRPEQVLTVGGLVVDLARRTARLDDRELQLTRREFDLLAYLAARPDRVVPRQELMDEVWQQTGGQPQTIDVHLSWLRRKLGETGLDPKYLHTVRGVGFRLSAPG